MPGTPLRSALSAQGVTLTTVAKAAGVSVGFVSKVVSGQKRSRAVEREIASCLGRPEAELFPPPQRARRSNDAAAAVESAHARAQRTELSDLVRTRAGRAQLRADLKAGLVPFPDQVALEALKVLDTASAVLDLDQD